MSQRENAFFSHVEAEKILGLDDPYEILGVSATSDFEKVKKHYKGLIKKWHPDRHIGEVLAVKVTQKINGAFEELMKPGTFRSGENRQGDNDDEQEKYPIQNNLEGNLSFLARSVVKEGLIFPYLKFKEFLVLGEQSYNEEYQIKDLSIYQNCLNWILSNIRNQINSGYQGEEAVQMIEKISLLSFPEIGKIGDLEEFSSSWRRIDTNLKKFNKKSKQIYGSN